MRDALAVHRYDVDAKSALAASEFADPSLENGLLFLRNECPDRFPFPFRRRMALANRTSGFGSTLLTGAAGDPGRAPIARKTLLGA